MRSRFRPGWLPTLATAVAVLVLLGLGTWQVQRLAWKRALLAEWHTRSEAPPIALDEALAGGEEIAWRRVRVRGRFDTQRSIFVMRVRQQAREGARVLTPLRPDAPGATVAVLVDRGWIPYSEVEGFAAELPPAEPIEVVGLGVPLELGEADPGDAPPRREWIRFDPDRHAAVLQPQLPYRLAPLLVQREAEPGSALPVAGFDPPRSRVDHRSYAITWYSMAAIAVAVWIGWGLTRAREANAP